MSFASMLNSTVEIQALAPGDPVVRDANGQIVRTWATIATVRARLVRDGVSASERASEFTAGVASTEFHMEPTTITNLHRIKFGSRYLDVIGVVKRMGRFALHHLEVSCREVQA